MGGDGVRDTKAKLGLTAGGFVVFSPNQSFSVQLGLRYSRTRTGIGPQTFTDSSPARNFRHRTVERTLTLEALDVPVLVRVRLPVGSLRLAVGPSVSFALSCDLHSTFTIETLNDPNRQIAGSSDCSGNTEGTNFAILLGAGLERRLVGGWFTVDLLYTHGVTVAYRGACTGRELNGAPGCVEDTGFDGKNRVLTLAIGVEFGR